MPDSRAEEWIIWNGLMGILDMVRLGRIEDGPERSAYLAAPYDVVGPFSLGELETAGRVSFGECLVMSREKWQVDQVNLRLEARAKRRAFLALFERDGDDGESRIALGLRQEGPLVPGEINAAFRRLAKKMHPDAGGSGEAYRRISEARDALLKQFDPAV